LVLNLTLRFIPSLFDLYRRVEDAHSLRRAGEVNQGNSLFHRMGRLLPTLTSVLILSVKRIAPLSMTLELRGIGLKNKRTTYAGLPRHPRVVFEFIGVLILLGIITCVLVIFSGLWYNVDIQ